MNHQKLDAIKYARTHQKTPTKCSLTQKQRAEKMNVLDLSGFKTLTAKQRVLTVFPVHSRSIESLFASNERKKPLNPAAFRYGV